MIFCLISDSPDVTASDLQAAAPALERNLGHCAHEHIAAPPAVVVTDKPLPQMIPVLFLDSSSDVGRLAEHYFDAARGVPAARVFVPSCSGFNNGSYSVVEAASHELLEAFCNPKLQKWLRHPDPTRAARGDEVPFEVCDMTQDHYTIDAGGTAWRVSNFVTPLWWSSDMLADPAKFKGERADYLGRLRPGQIGPEGYSVFRRLRPDGRYERWIENAHGVAGSLAAHKLQPLARTGRLLDGGINRTQAAA